MRRSLFLLPVSAALAAVLAAQAGIAPSVPSAQPAPVSIGETAAAVHKALGPWDAYVNNGPAGSQTESYFDAGLLIKYQADRVNTMTVGSLVGRAGYKAHLRKPGNLRQAAVTVTRLD